MHECEAESFDFDWCIPLNTEINCTESCMVCFSKHFSYCSKDQISVSVSKLHLSE